MNIADLIFLYAAEEKSISKAASRAFVSQQCASKHIQNLESRYGVPLIQRRPHFALTEAGQALFATLQQIHLLESGVAEHIAELGGGSTGTLAIGINASRARLCSRMCCTNTGKATLKCAFRSTATIPPAWRKCFCRASSI